MKAVRQEQADRKACNDKYGTTDSPERRACHKKVEPDRRAANEACKSLSKDQPKNK
jgi:hypothetical protein